VEVIEERVHCGPNSATRVQTVPTLGTTESDREPHSLRLECEVLVINCGDGGVCRVFSSRSGDERQIFDSAWLDWSIILTSALILEQGSITNPSYPCITLSNYQRAPGDSREFQDTLRVLVDLGTSAQRNAVEVEADEHKHRKRLRRRSS